MFTLKHFPKELWQTENTALLCGILRGIERETLRVTAEGKLASTPHPEQLGSALCHPHITTDFSEALLEFITPPSHKPEALLEHLARIQSFVCAQLDDELLWNSSMPCTLPDDKAIPVAQYGKSNNGMMKTIYRLGLSQRYGRAMQTVAGLHYNFSLPNAFWALLAEQANALMDLQRFKNKAYFALIRNFRRHYWLLIYLFGASPGMDKSFVKGRSHDLENLSHNTLYRPFSTSLRMGDLGYQSAAQQSLFICHNQRSTYIQSLCNAITTPVTHYQDIGLFDEQGNYQQLNTSLLQIENEFYSPIRPKRTAHPGETALNALSDRGVEYIEVRCLDLDPFEPLGIGAEQIAFLDTFLLYCALQESPACDERENDAELANQRKVVNWGRQPGLMLEHPDVGKIGLQEWGSQLCQAMEPLAQLMDKANQTQIHSNALENQLKKIHNPLLTPSAKVLAEMAEKSHIQSILELSGAHQKQVQHLDRNILLRMQDMAEQSWQEQKNLEARSTLPFDEFLQNYYKQYDCCSSSG